MQFSVFVKAEFESGSTFIKKSLNLSHAMSFKYIWSYGTVNAQIFVSNFVHFFSSSRGKEEKQSLPSKCIYRLT